MKKVIIIGLILACLTSNSQVSFSVPVGVSSLKVPTIGSNIQIGIGNFIAAAGFDAHMSRKVANGDYFWLRGGVGFHISELNRIEFAAGAGSYRRSADTKGMNEGLMLLNAQYVHYIDSQGIGALFASVTGTKEFVMATGGLRFVFRKRVKDGCPSTWVR